MFTYSKKIFVVMVLLSVAAGLFSTKFQFYPATFGTGAVIFMALNALAALYPLYFFRGKKNPFNVYILGMMVRLLVIGVALILTLFFGGLDKSSLLAITLTGMLSFLVYLAVEIHHFIHHDASLMST